MPLVMVNCLEQELDISHCSGLLEIPVVFLADFFMDLDRTCGPLTLHR